MHGDIPWKRALECERAEHEILGRALAVARSLHGWGTQCVECAHATPLFRESTPTQIKVHCGLRGEAQQEEFACLLGSVSYPVGTVPTDFERVLETLTGYARLKN